MDVLWLWDIDGEECQCYRIESAYNIILVQFRYVGFLYQLHDAKVIKNMFVALITFPSFF